MNINLWSEEDKTDLLNFLRSCKENGKIPLSIAVSNFFDGNYVTTKGSSSPFNMNDFISAPGFDKQKHVTPLFNQYFKQKKEIESHIYNFKDINFKILFNKIVSDIYLKTNGRQGLTIELGNYLDGNFEEIFNQFKIENKSKFDITIGYNKWVNLTKNEKLFNFLETTVNFHKMNSILMNEANCECINSLKKLIFDVKFLNYNEKLIPLVKANVVKFLENKRNNIEFTSPIIKEYFQYFFLKVNITPLEEIPFEKKLNFIDIEKLIIHSIKNMNWHRIFSERKKSQNLFDKTITPGPIEDIYDSEFKNSLQNILKKFSCFLFYEKNSFTGYKPDLVFDFEQDNILLRYCIEHGANLDNKKNSKDPYSVKLHYNNQCVNYQEKIDCTETFLINWITSKFTENEFILKEKKNIKIFFVYSNPNNLKEIFLYKTNKKEKIEKIVIENNWKYEFPLIKTIKEKSFLIFF
jgi:hypothetical protein